MEKFTQEMINAVVWKACDSFRGTIDAAQYKDYILTMLFVKYTTDVTKERKNKNIKKYDGDEARIKRAMGLERFKIPDECTFDYIYEKRNEENLGEIINKALEEIEVDNRLKLGGVFRNIDFNSESNLGQTKDRNRRLKNLILDLSELELGPSNLVSNDVIGDAYEFLIYNFAAGAGKKAGEFYTPANVSSLLAKLVEPESGNRISDPTCGSASLLIKAALEVNDKNVAIFGQEVNGSTWALARMNIFLHELDNANIEWGDTLNNPLLIKNDSLMKFDRVVANPPFSLDKWGVENAASDRYNRFHRGVPPKSKGDYAFVTHIVETLNETGRGGVVLPHGVLFRGSSEGKIRQQLIKENLLKAVIGLPPNLFFGTSIPACILIFDKNKGTNTDVLFIDASREFENGKNQNNLRPEDISKIYDTYSNWKEIDKYSHIAKIKEIEENDYNLNIPRYVDTFEEEEPVDIKEVQSEIKKLKKELGEVEAKMDAYLVELGL